MANQGYPLFIPPDDLSSMSRREWTRKQAKAYFEWLMAAMPGRVADLLDHFGVDRTGLSPRELLTDLGDQVAQVLVEDEFTRPNGDNPRTLTNAGYALAADMGLLVAELLLERLGDRIWWEIVRKPRRDVSYNLPVLEGFGPVYFEPVGASIGNVQGILHGNRSSDIWLKMYDTCCDKVL